MIRKVGELLVVAGVGVSLAACGATPSPANAPASQLPASHPTVSAAAESVYVEMDPTPPESKPAEFDIYDHTDLTGINWSSWGGPTAQGAGVLEDDDCTPDCASGHDDTFPAKIVLTDVRTVNGNSEYTRYTVTFQGQDRLPDLAKALTDQPTNPRH
jgi:hypothetical protein